LSARSRRSAKAGRPILVSAAYAQVRGHVPDYIPISVSGLAHIVFIDSHDDKEVIFMAYHVDEKHSPSDFRRFEFAMCELDDAELAALYAGTEALALEGALYGDQCSGCVLQQENGTRALRAIEREMKRRASSN
jgi:hypothetical protein